MTSSSESALCTSFVMWLKISCSGGVGFTDFRDKIRFEIDYEDIIGLDILCCNMAVTRQYSNLCPLEDSDIAQPHSQYSTDQREPTKENIQDTRLSRWSKIQGLCTTYYVLLSLEYSMFYTRHWMRYTIFIYRVGKRL